MRKWKQRVIAVVLAIVMVAGIYPMKAEASEPATVNEEQVRARVLELANKLGINITSLDQNGNGVYFTADGACCTTGDSHGSCSNCHNTNVIKADWFVNTFGTISSVSLFPRHYSAYVSGGTISYDAYTCAGFAAFALWYIAKEDNTSNVNRIYLGSSQIQTFSIENLKASDIRVGDVIRISIAGKDAGHHSMMFISMDEANGTIKVLDCNWGTPKPMVRIHDISMSAYSGYNMAITRASNYDPGEKTESEVTYATYQEAIAAKAKTYGEYTQTSFINAGYSDIPNEWNVWFIKHCADQVGAGAVFSSATVASSFYEEMTNPNGAYKATGVYFDEGNITDYSCYKYATAVDRSTYVPQVGDIICLNWNGEGATSVGHMGIVTGYDATTQKIAFVDGYVRSTESENLRVKVRDGNSYELFSLTNSQIVGYIRPDYAALSVSAFSDVDLSAWYASAVGYVYTNGIMSGVSENLFYPESSLTRAEFVTVLYAMEGKPEITYTTIFSDVGADTWYTKPVYWAYQNGITSGIGGGRFGTNDNITREQLALMLYTYARQKGYDMTSNAGLTESFADASQISSWSQSALQWAVTQGVMSGKPAGTTGAYILDPQGNASRAECAAMIKSLLEKNK